MMLEAKLVLLLFIANGTPIIARRLVGDRLAWPLDFNRRFVDGRPLLGPAKTWRGLVLAIISASLAAPLLGLSLVTGALVGTFAMLGDLAASFTKRRLGRPSSSSVLVLDQVPESLLPALACKVSLGLGWGSVVVIVVIFFGVGLLLSRLLYRLNIRDRPY